jgi:hypothetical protein
MTAMSKTPLVSILILAWNSKEHLPLCLPSHLWALMRIAFSVLIKQRRGIVFKALWDASRGLPAVLRSRGEVQSLRQVRLRELYRIMRTGRVER